jgi:hypothetical protein
LAGVVNKKNLQHHPVFRFFHSKDPMTTKNFLNYKMTLPKYKNKKAIFCTKLFSYHNQSRDGLMARESDLNAEGGGFGLVRSWHLNLNFVTSSLAK